MNYKTLNDSRHTLPAKVGMYSWYSKYLHDYIPVNWNGINFSLITGQAVSNETVRLWR